MIEREALAELVDERVVPPPLPAGLANTLSRAAVGPTADRMVGALLGCALGDALGRPNESRSAHGRIRIEQFDPRLAGISDDTQLTIEIARNLVAHGGAFDPVGFGEQLVAWLPRAVGIGRATPRRRAAAARRRTVARRRDTLGRQRGRHPRRADRSRARGKPRSDAARGRRVRAADPPRRDGGGQQRGDGLRDRLVPRRQTRRRSTQGGSSRTSGRRWLTWSTRAWRRASPASRAGRPWRR